MAQWALAIGCSPLTNGLKSFPLISVQALINNSINKLINFPVGSQ
jgi:hypothetical protein